MKNDICVLASQDLKELLLAQCSGVQSEKWEYNAKVCINIDSTVGAWPQWANFTLPVYLFPHLGFPDFVMFMD